jgi:hypothetical protein
LEFRGPTWESTEANPREDLHRVLEATRTTIFVDGEERQTVGETWSAPQYSPEQDLWQTNLGAVVEPLNPGEHDIEIRVEFERPYPVSVGEGGKRLRKDPISTELTVWIVDNHVGQWLENLEQKHQEIVEKQRTLLYWGALLYDELLSNGPLSDVESPEEFSRAISGDSRGTTPESKPNRSYLDDLHDAVTEVLEYDYSIREAMEVVQETERGVLRTELRETEALLKSYRASIRGGSYTRDSYSIPDAICRFCSIQYSFNECGELVCPDCTYRDLAELPFYDETFATGLTPKRIIYKN